MPSYVEDPCRATPRVHAAPNRGSMPRYVKPYTVWPGPNISNRGPRPRWCPLFFRIFFLLHRIADEFRVPVFMPRWHLLALVCWHHGPGKTIFAAQLGILVSMVWAQKPVDPSLWAQKNQTKLPSVWAEKISGGNRIVFGGGVVDSVGTRINPSATRDDSGGTRIESG